ncbi:hypothetical protein QEN19_000514 [Hanseniaspora menglaensis]
MSENHSEDSYSNIDYLSLLTDNSTPKQLYDDKSQINTFTNGRISPLSKLMIHNNESYNLSTGNKLQGLNNVSDYTTIRANSSEFNNSNHGFNNISSISNQQSSTSVPLLVNHRIQTNMLPNSAGYIENSNLNDNINLQRSSSVMQMGSASSFGHISQHLPNSHYENKENIYGAYYGDQNQYSQMENRNTSSPYMIDNSQYHLYQQKQIYFQQQQQQQQQLLQQQYQQQQFNISQSSLPQSNIIYRYEMNPNEYLVNSSQKNPMNSSYTDYDEKLSNTINSFSRSSTPTNSVASQTSNTSLLNINSAKICNESLNQNSEPTRTLLLTNIPSTTTSKTILNHVKLGIVQQLLILPDLSKASNQQTHSAKLTFLNLQHAIEFYYDAILKKLTIDNSQISVSYIEEQQIGSLTMKLLNMAEFKPTRNLFISGLYDQQNEEALHKKLILDLSSFGPIDHIKIIFKKGIAFIHFLDIEDCIRVFLSLKNFSKYYEMKKIGFGRDRCEFVTITEKYNATVASSSYLLTNGSHYIGDGNRTIFLGNLPQHVTMTDICNTIRGGTLEKINLLNEKNICFITFVDPVAAFNFNAFYEKNVLTILNKKIKVSWGKHSGDLKPLLKLAIMKGASRNVYIGGLKLGKYFNKDNKKEPFSEFNIRKKFGKFGELEQINFLISKDCFFVNFAEIQSAIECLDKIRDDPLYKNLQVNFGKDRVANKPRH